MYHDWGRVNLSFNFISETGFDTHENDFGYTWGVFRQAAWTGMDMGNGAPGMDMCKGKARMGMRKGTSGMDMGKEMPGMDMGKGATEMNGMPKASPPPVLSMRRLGYGLEMMGALGNQHQFGVVWPREQQYVGPVFNYTMSTHWSIAVEPTFGLSRVSDPFVLRLGFRYSTDHLFRRGASPSGGH